MNSSTNEPRVLGLDLGHTIYDNPKKQVFPDAFRVIRRLALEVFKPENVHIVSRVTPEQEVRARKFIQSQEFQAKTGIPIEQAHFCAERHEKAPICLRLGVTVFVDDRPGVLVCMPPRIERVLFNPTEEDLRDYASAVQSMLIVQNWKEVESLFFNT